MDENVIIVDGKPVLILNGEIDKKTTGVAISQTDNLEDTLEFKPISEHESLEDTLYDIKVGDINE